MSDEQDPGKLLRFVPRPEGAPVTVTQPSYRNCSHRDFGVIVDEQARTACCNKCGVKLDPIQALVNLAQTWAKWERETKIRRDILNEDRRLETERAERYNARHRKRHPAPVNNCPQCWNCERNDALITRYGSPGGTSA